MKILIVGTGGVGGYFGGLLAKAGNDVTFFARGEHAQALKTNGLQVKSVVGDFVVENIKVIEDLSQTETPDFVMFTVKTYDTDLISQELSKIVNSNTVIITFQNGVDNVDKIKKYISNATVLPGVAYVISTKTKPGFIDQTGGYRKLVLGYLKKDQKDKVENIVDIMKKSGIDAVLSNNIIIDVWKKFVFIVAFSGLSGLTHKNIGELLSDTFTKVLYESCIKETLKVASKIHLNLPADIFESTMKVSNDFNKTSKSSLLVDIENGRKTEIEALSGTVAKLAQKYKISAPVNTTIYVALKDVNL